MSQYAFVFGYYLLDFLIALYELNSGFVSIFMEVVPFFALAYGLFVMLQTVMKWQKESSLPNNVKTYLRVYFTAHALSWSVSFAIAVTCWFVASWLVSFLSVINILMALCTIAADYHWACWAEHALTGASQWLGMAKHKESLVLDAGMWLIALGLMVGSLCLFNATLLSSSLWLVVVATRYIMDVCMTEPNGADKAKVNPNPNTFDVEKLLATGDINLSRVIAIEPRHAWTNGM